jgi:hypothetical protein
MIDRRSAFAFAVAAATLTITPAAAVPPEFWSLEPDKRLAFDIENANFLTLAPNNPFAAKIIKGLPVRHQSYVTEIRLLRDADTAPARFAEVTRYDYGTGLTWRTTVDLKKGKATDVRADANQPTPLSTVEIQEAARLVTSRFPEVNISPEKATARAFNSTSPTDKLYGHRLLLLWQEQPKRTNRFLVDLTTQNIVNPNF